MIQIRWQRIARLFSIVGLIHLLNACGSSIDVAEWSEEIKLHDGTMTMVSRKARAYKNGFPNSERGRDIDFEIKYAPMDIQWKGSWNRTPVSFEIIDNVPYLVLLIGDADSCANRSPEDYRAEFLRWSKGQWEEIKQADFPTDKAVINLSVDYWGYNASKDYKGLIHWADKRLPEGYSQADPDTIRTYFETYRQFCRIFNKQ